MTWFNRLRLYGGMLAVLLLVAVLVLVFNQRQSEAVSTNAQIVTDQYSVGAAYGGTVVKQDVKLGDSVTKGQPLFTLSSAALATEVAAGRAVPSTDAFSVDTGTSTVTYKALADGQLTDVEGQVGTFIQTGSSLATISATNSQYAVADFLLSPRDYQRIVQGATVELLLPDNSTVPGKVGAVSVKTDNAQAHTTVTVISDSLHDSSIADLTHPGTPLTATLSLRDDGVLAGPSDAMTGFLQQIGLK
jgi:multidrug resistance efflux pump